MTLGKQARLEAGCSSVSSTEGVINKGKGTRGPTGMSEITWISCDGHKRVIEYNELDQSIGESATKLKSFIGTTVRVHVPISYQSWKDVPTELKDKIYEPIEMVSNKGREQRKNNKYNHRMWRKGYANIVEEMKASTSSGGLIDRALVWKKARTTKDREIPDIDTKEVANKIISTFLLVGQYVTPSKYFHTAREKRKKVSKEEDYAKERARMATRILELEAELIKHKRVPEVATKRETDESKIKSQMAFKSNDMSDDANDHDAEEENRQVQDKNKDVCASIGTLTKVKDGTSCRLAIRTKDNVVGAKTIFDYDMDGDNIKVSVDMVADGNCFVPVPTREGRTMHSQEVGSQLLWPHHLVIPLDEKMKSVYQADPQLPSLTLNTKRALVTLRLLLWELDYIGSKIQVHIPAKVFGYQRKCWIFLEALQEFCQIQPISTQCIDAFMFHLYKVMEEKGTLGSYKFADAGSVSVAIDFSRGTAYWMDPLRNRINNEASDVVRMAFDISNKKKPVWRIIKIPKQGGIVEYSIGVCGRDEGGGKSMFRLINDLGSWERGGGSAKFMFKLNFDFRKGEGVRN
ncbi:uncharacterized protein E5676_scaffold609G001390 [Cucumis melo var. makuwa]|uniref:Transposase Tnp1/En/Spm-like domain-containing protein n=1 Tax=Cucumis melo var. makuwa TaxID=1194695 RepID=A0A5A7U8W3_CUCMM|nr:uncharacterized protein E6C27_scaffold60G001780 [Cucumis melo var. makuwa]TYK21463.1 uncharacterized protein E5676_scaffold609G001390 [Cucumis melo var. makuwa]